MPEFQPCLQLFNMDIEEGTPGHAYLTNQGLPLTNWHSIVEDFDFFPLILDRPWIWPWANVIRIKCKFVKAVLQPNQTENPLTPRVRELIEKYAHIWEAHCNIKFEFVDSGPADVRISLVRDTGCWSYVGTSCKVVPAEQPTMNYSWLYDNSPEEVFCRTVTHEFGHALGCVHEQFSPAAKFTWIKQNVYDDYATQGWDPAKVDAAFNNFVPVDPDSHQFSNWDPDSIMHYPLKSNWTVEGHEVGWNSELAPIDIEFIRRLYPS
ncbi:hypothetical protein AA313_de0200404 [Arthrobotrys entomopaga]|nr:hypothetical protein AA313_de0200404 [Arthrobotrys entomopaga]